MHHPAVHRHCCVRQQQQRLAFLLTRLCHYAAYCQHVGIIGLDLMLLGLKSKTFDLSLKVSEPS